MERFLLGLISPRPSLRPRSQMTATTRSSSPPSLPSEILSPLQPTPTPPPLSSTQKPKPARTPIITSPSPIPSLARSKSTTSSISTSPSPSQSSSQAQAQAAFHTSPERGLKLQPGSRSLLHLTQTRRRVDGGMDTGMDSTVPRSGPGIGTRLNAFLSHDRRWCGPLPSTLPREHGNLTTEPGLLSSIPAEEPDREEHGAEGPRA
jgi:hypothetical protein